MLRRFIAFLTPTILTVVALAVLGVVINFLIPGIWLEGYANLPAGLTADELRGLDLNGVVIPKPELSPEEVVQVQLSGLAQPETNGLGILQCYCFASPTNKRVTGPLERFAHLVRRKPYDALRRPQAVLIGQPQLEGRVARVLVTVFDENSEVRAFTFVLGKQLEGWCRDCWMTEAVYPSMMPSNDVTEPPKQGDLEDAA